MPLSQRLAALKKAANMTTETLSGISGVPKGTINKLLNGETENPRAQTLQRLASALGCSPEALYSDSPAQPRPDSIASASENALYSASSGKILPISLTVSGESDPLILPGADFVLRMPDDSMIASRIKAGDIVFIANDPSPEDGSIAAVRLDGTITLRRIYRIKDGVTLMSENPSFPPSVLTGDSAASLEILGRAVSFTSIL